MEKDPDAECGSSSSCVANGKSKLDTLSKDDLIKFAKKQMAAMQKLKLKCTDLEEKVEAMKTIKGDTSNDSVIQELTERMDAVLLEKAETQQMLVLMRKENEKLRNQSEESIATLAALQKKLDHSEKDNTEKIKLMEEQIENTETKYRDELEFFKKMSNENEEIQRCRLQEDFNSQIQAIRQEYESKISDLEQSLELSEKEWITDKEALKETHQKTLLKTQEDFDSFKEMISRLNKQHEDEVRYLEEQLEINAADFDMERERLLLVQEELSEQIALKESYLQDVQEEEEDLHRRTQKPSELLKTLDSSSLEGPENEMDKLRLNLLDLQSENTMIKEELTFLTNVKTELEGDLKHLKEEFSMEREELEFKINELQMTKEEGEICPEKEVNYLSAAKTICFEEHDRILHEINVLHKAEMEKLEACLISNNEREKEVMVQAAQDLQNTCKKLSEENKAITTEYEHTKEILRDFEMDLGDRTSDFVKKYNAMKEQAAVSIQELEEKLREKNSVIEKLEQKYLEQTQDKSCNTSAKVFPVSMEEMAQMQKDHQSAFKECDAPETNLETNEEKLFEARKQLCYILAQYYSVKIDEDEDISGLLNHLLCRVEEDKSICILLNEEKAKLQEDLQAVSDERNDLKTFIETKERKQFDTQKQVCEILEQHYFVKIAGEEDLSVLLNHLLSIIQEEKMSCNVLKEEKNKHQNDLVTVVQERDDLKRRIETHESKLSDAQKNICEMLGQNFSVNIDKEEDISVLLKHLLSRVQEEKLILTEQLGEKEMQLLQQKQQADLNDDRYLQTSSPNRALADTENLQGVQNQQGEITGNVVSQEHEEPAGENGAQETDDMKGLQQKLSEKESIIAHLKEEISHLLESKLSTLNEKMKQIDCLEKESKEKEERLNKFKAVAVKARKELDKSKKETSRLTEELEALRAERDKMSDSMKAIIHGAEAYKNLMIEYDKQNELLDKEKEKLVASEKLVGDLTKRLHEVGEQHKQLSSERDDMMAHTETLQSNVRQLESQALEMHKLKSLMERDLEAERLLKEQITKEHACAVKEVEELHILLQKQKQQLQQSEQELEQLRKDAQQSTLLDMEMADYERLVKNLNLQLSDKDRLLKELERQTQAQREREENLNQEIESLKSLVDIGEEKTAKVKQLLVKTKKDLAEAKKAEASQMTLQSSMKGELEEIQQQLEIYKIQCSELTADRHRLQEQLKSVSDQYQKSVTSYQSQVTALQNDLSSTKAEFESTKSEFESYKVRVHNVLKQQKSKSTTQGDNDCSKQDRETMETMVDQLRSKLQESQLNAKSCNVELQQLQTEYDTLLERHNKMLQQTITKEAELRERLLSLHSENVALKSEHSQSVAQLTAQAETLRSSFREQLHHFQDEHRSTVETLQHQINSLETQLFQLQKETATSVSQQQSKKLQSEKKLTDLPLFEINMAREEGEGMETTETESISTAGTPPPSLEQLLTSPDPKHEPFVWQVEPTKEELTNQLNTATRSMEHMNSLLHESEATNAILMEQINLLKSEMRRLERNQEREKSVANLEYLKNVLLQFIFLHPGSEKQSLLPVIHTMLQLSPEEKSKLSAIAHGEEEAAASRGSGWTSYLHSWSGIR
ncbi:GRIP and coiled-coil domain-containing protein 2 isoform X1 [Tachysurus vachellii]|uniref:GRIP and coiled-coil domain-containing protein 2 isoform X1 n=1 Tax=Tachysurus vachellii TaxID=175792 RepID=UPI00296ADB6E|nr:GRIP and coiled-coil domain-containing protein 2 isoform X1 [Tachysurus vachellii]